jgi:hypothetical protein
MIRSTTIAIVIALVVAVSGCGGRAPLVLLLSKVGMVPRMKRTNRARTVYESRAAGGRAGVIQIAHGMGEHSRRYSELIAALQEEGGARLLISARCDSFEYRSAFLRDAE